MNTMLTDCTSANDVRDRYVLPSLSPYAVLPSLSPYAYDFDVDAIVSDVIVGWTIEPTPHAIVVHDDDFWRIVKTHATPTHLDTHP